MLKKCISEVDQLKAHLPDGRVLKRFMPEKELKKQLKDGGVSIIDQWICAHARY